MIQHLKQLERTDKTILIVGATEHGCRSCTPTGWSERRISRWVGIGVLAMTLGTLALGPVDTSPTRSAIAVRTNVIPATPPPAPYSPQQRPKAASQAMRQTSRAHIPHAFIENRGQTASRVGYDVQGQKDTFLSFTPQGLTIVLTEFSPAPDIIRKTTWNRAPIAQDGAATLQRRVVTLAFVGANPEAHPQWQEPMAATVSSLTALQPQEKSTRNTSVGVRYRDVWPGIDLLYTVTGDELRSTLFIQPGADPNRIQLAYRGVTAVRRTEAGRLEVTTPNGSFSEDAPVAYQESEYLVQLGRLREGVAEEMAVARHERDGQRVAVAVTYTLEISGDTSFHGIHVGAYDPNTLLIVDWVVRYSGSMKRSDSDPDLGHAANRTGSVHVNAPSAPRSNPTHKAP